MIKMPEIKPKGFKSAGCCSSCKHSYGRPCDEIYETHCRKISDLNPLPETATTRERYDINLVSPFNICDEFEESD